MHWLAGAIGVVLLIAGCTAPSPPPADVDAAAPTPPSAVRTSIRSENASSEFAIDADGDAGSWIVIHLPFHTVWDNGGYAVTFDAVADAEAGSGAFLWPLSMTQKEGDGWTAGRLPVFYEHLLTFDADQTWSERTGIGFSSSSGYSGMVFAFAAQAPWTLSLNVELDGNTFANHTILRGDNATFAHGGQSLVPVPDSGPVNQVTFAATSPGPGWSHLELLRQRLQPDGVSQIDLQLANGDEASELGTQDGYHLVVLGSASGGHLDALGSLTDVAGSISAEATFARGDLAMEFGYVHIPFTPDQLPGLAPGFYAGSTWPFEDITLPGP